MDVKELFEKRSAIDASIAELRSVLEKGGVKSHEDLVDGEGFPRGDIDIVSAANALHQIARLRNDRYAVAREMEAFVHARLSGGGDSAEGAAAGPSGASEKRAGNAATATAAAAYAAEVPAAEPFARVNSLTFNGPAYTSGLRQGDRIIKIGHVTSRSKDAMGELPALVAGHENRRIAVQVLRVPEGAEEEAVVDLALVPRRGWGGLGLLGCHIVPV